MYTYNSCKTSTPTAERQSTCTKKATRSSSTISPKVFKATLVSVFRRLNWESKGMRLQGEYVIHLRHADKIFIGANTSHELQQMLQELPDETENQCLKLNNLKEKEMMENHTSIYVNTTQIENIESYVYLEQIEASEIKLKKRRFKVLSRPNGQHSSTTTTCKRVTLEHALRDKSTTYT